MKSESLNLLEPSGPVQACTGIALPLPLYIYLSLIQGADRTTGGVPGEINCHEILRSFINQSNISIWISEKQN
jgi:hypothetical protein